MNALKSLLLDELADVYDAEHRTLEVFLKIRKASVAHELKTLLRSHSKENQRQLKKLERIFKHLGKVAKRRTCTAAAGLLKQAQATASHYKGSPAVDAALISAAQKIAHYQIAAYGCLQEWAELLGHSAAAGLLQEVLDDKQAANDALTTLAIERSNQEAMTGHGDKADASPPGDAPPEWRRGKPGANGNPSVVLPPGANPWGRFRR